MKNNVWVFIVIQKGNLETLTSLLPTQKKWFWRVWSGLIYFVYDLHYPGPLLSVDMAGGSILSALCVTDTLLDLSLIGAGQLCKEGQSRDLALQTKYICCGLSLLSWSWWKNRTSSAFVLLFISPDISSNTVLPCPNSVLWYFYFKCFRLLMFRYSSDVKIEKSVHTKSAPMFVTKIFPCSLSW